MKKTNSYLSFIIVVVLIAIVLFLLRKNIAKVAQEIKNDLRQENLRLKQQKQDIYYQDRNKAIDAALSNINK